MACARMRAALKDCQNAIYWNPHFHKVQVRAAKCHLALGEISSALQYFKESLPQGADQCLDRELVIDASKGMEKAKHARVYMKTCGELLLRRRSADAEKALLITEKALLICPYSEELVEMKAEALHMLLKYDETIQLCEQSLDSAEKNSAASLAGSEKFKNCHARLWRWCLMAKSYFYLGRLEEALCYFEELERVDAVSQKFGNKIPESVSTLAVAARKLLHHKAAGTEAFMSGRHAEAVEHYTFAITCSSASHPFAAICFYNRAAAHQALGRMKAALGDCNQAAELNPDFLEVQVRAANCHLALGEVEEALRCFKGSLPRAGLCLDRKLAIEASNGLQKVQQVRECFDRCEELLCKQTPCDAESALQIITEALIISPYSEKLVKMKAEALVLLLKYEEMLELCEQTLDAADRNSSSVIAVSSEKIQNYSARIWRWHLMSKSYFYLGRLEEALKLFEKLKQAESGMPRYGCETPGSMGKLAITVRDMLNYKVAGREAFQSSRHLEAVKHFTSALSLSLESRPFAAMCFYECAAAHQASGKIIDAIADCSLAISLVGNYPKAISKRATLLEMIRDYRQAATDLQRLISEQNFIQTGVFVKSTNDTIDLIQARLRLSMVEEKVKKGIPLDMYLILGVKSSCKTSDIKKAYKRAALRHHPDKAHKLLPKYENGYDEVWKDIAVVVHKDAHELFKMIGEAYEVLSNKDQRSRYDAEEAKRN